jgi:hypothetical protein
MKSLFVGDPIWGNLIRRAELQCNGDESDTPRVAGGLMSGLPQRQLPSLRGRRAEARLRKVLEFAR